MAMDKRRSMKRYLPMSDIYPIKPISESWFRYECLLHPLVLPRLLASAKIAASTSRILHQLHEFACGTLNDCGHLHQSKYLGARELYKIARP